MDTKDEQQKAIILEIPMARAPWEHDSTLRFAMDKDAVSRGSDPTLRLAKDGASARDGAPSAVETGVPGTPIFGMGMLRVDGVRATPVRESARPRCAAVRGDGRRCIFPAKDGLEKCERHQRWYASVPPMLGMPYPEDAISLQEVMAQTVAMVLNRELDADKALAIQKLCQTMEKNLVSYKREVADAEGEVAMVSRVRRIQ